MCPVCHCLESCLVCQVESYYNSVAVLVVQSEQWTVLLLAGSVPQIHEVLVAVFVDKRMAVKGGAESGSGFIGEFFVDEGLEEGGFANVWDGKWGTWLAEHDDFLGFVLHGEYELEWIICFTKYTNQ